MKENNAKETHSAKFQYMQYRIYDGIKYDIVYFKNEHVVLKMPHNAYLLTKGGTEKFERGIIIFVFALGSLN